MKDPAPPPGPLRARRRADHGGDNSLRHGHPQDEHPLRSCTSTSRRASSPYYQETGRAGRDGLQAVVACLLYGAGDAVKIKYFINQIPEETRRVAANHHLTALTAYRRASSGCGRFPLLTHFGEEYGDGELRHAATTASALPRPRWTIPWSAKKFLSCVKRTGESSPFARDRRPAWSPSRRRCWIREHQHLSTYNIGGALEVAADDAVRRRRAEGARRQ
ncbi:MAG: hypothetical protein MZV63_07250, partial [Marinilabiliales bacterium]|nr:hypothetical protein [Marinilabiliales bacterium]